MIHKNGLCTSPTILASAVGRWIAEVADVAHSQCRAQFLLVVRDPNHPGLTMSRARITRGFTLIELVVTVVIISIIAAVVAYRIGAATENAVVNNADQLRRNLSHVQALALGWGAKLRLTTASNGLSYSVT